MISITGKIESSNSKGMFRVQQERRVDSSKKSNMVLKKATKYMFYLCVIHIIVGSMAPVDAAVPADHLPRDPDSDVKAAPLAGQTGKPPLVGIKTSLKTTVQPCYNASQ